MTEELVSATEAAAIAHCTPQAINRAIKEGRLPAVRVGHMNVIRKADVLQWQPREYSRKENDA